MLRIYHNNRCSKSRAAKEALTLCNMSFETVEYLNTPLTAEQIKTLFGKMNGVTARDLCREKLSETTTDEEIFQFLAENPKALQRPIVEYGDKAIIGRPTELVEDFLKQISNE